MSRRNGGTRFGPAPLHRTPIHRIGRQFTAADKPPASVVQGWLRSERSRLTMRHSTIAIALAAAVAAGCGGNEKTSADTTKPGGAAPAVTPSGSSSVSTPAPATGKTWQVRMLGDDKGYRYDPASLTIKVGDAIHWSVVSGIPHNVTFWADSIPTGAATALGADMPNTTAPLMGPMLTAVGDSYTITFAGVPTGTYRYYCTPHLALGMKGTLTIR